MRQGTRDENKRTQGRRLSDRDLRGWATAPRYDAATHKLYWAKDLQFEGDPRARSTTTSACSGAWLPQPQRDRGQGPVPDVQAGMQQMLPMVSSTRRALRRLRQAQRQGRRLWLAALVGGGIAAKAGLFGKLGLLLLGLKKAADSAGLLGAAAMGRKVMGLFRKKDARGSTVA